jgi:tRNA-dihydrouridine synthase B
LIGPFASIILACLFLSPLAGYTNLPARLVICEVGGVDLCATDLVNVRSLIERNPKALKLIETNDADLPLAVQLFGAVPEKIRNFIGSSGSKQKPNARLG